MLYLQRILWIGVIAWCSVGLVEELKARRATYQTGRPNVLAPRKWVLGKPYAEKVREFCRQAAEVIPEGETVGVLANHRVNPRQRPMLRMWLAYFMPAHHILLLPQFPEHQAKSVEAARPGRYFLAYRYRPIRIPGLETVWEDSIGGVYRVAP